VMIGLPNGIEFVAATFATWKLGAVPMPVSHRLPHPERAAIADLARPGLVLGFDDLDTYASLPAGFEPPPTATTEDDTPPPPAVSPSWKAPTSGGSTGRPKIIRATQPSLFEEVELNLVLFGLGLDDV